MLTLTGESLTELLNPLPQRHQKALAWFAENAGTIQGWPGPLAIPGFGETLVATQAKGIYKPEWSEFALSVKQTLGGPYADLEPIFRDDGTWVFKYFQENPDPSLRDTQYTNVGLMACIRDKVPVGVLRQVKRKPGVKYRVLGLALVSRWENGYFYLEGFSPSGHSHQQDPATEIEQLSNEELEAAITDGSFEPTGLTDARKRVLGQIVRRQGQPEFRNKLLCAYEGKCAVTGCDAVAALEAAHISPYLGPKTNMVGNGLLLRSDIHTLFDLGQIAVAEGSLKILIAPVLKGTMYESLLGSALRVPANPLSGPSLEALEAHRLWAGL